MLGPPAPLFAALRLYGKSSAGGMITSAVCFPLPRKAPGVAASIAVYFMADDGEFGGCPAAGIYIRSSAQELILLSNHEARILYRIEYSVM